MLVETDMRYMQLHNNVRSPPKRKGMKPNNKCLVTANIVILCYYLYSTSWCCDAQETDRKLVDLSHTFDDDTIYWVTTKKLNFTVTHNGTDPSGRYWYQSDEISAGTHGGTHIDAPCHFAMGRWCVSDIPLDHLVVPAVVVDISKDVKDSPDVHLSQEHLLKWEKINGQIPDGSLLLVRTGWSRFWPDPLRYSGTRERDRKLLRFPSIMAEAAKWLVDNRNIVGIGIDVMSIDVPNQQSDVHTTLMAKNIYGLENVNLLESLPPKGIKAYVMPMKLKDASGAPCRVLVEMSADAATSGNVGTGNSVSIIWTTAILAVLAWIFS